METPTGAFLETIAAKQGVIVADLGINMGIAMCVCGMCMRGISA